MVASTELEVVPREALALFPGLTPEDIIVAATDVANRFSDIVKQRNLYKRIGANDHVLVEGWQTVGALVGVYATKDGGVRELPWPILAPLGDEPEDKRTAAWAAWDQHRKLLTQRDMGRAYGFAAAFYAKKNGAELGWGEGRCNRGEEHWVARDDYALSSQAQTRGQGRTLSQPLRFVVKLAGYSGTPAEEIDSPNGVAPAPGSPYGVTVDADGDREIAGRISQIFPEVDGAAFVRIVNRRFATDHLPDAAAKMVEAIVWARGADAVRTQAPENAPPDPDAGAYYGAVPDD